MISRHIIEYDNIIVFRLLRVESDALCWFSYIEFILQLFKLCYI